MGSKALPLLSKALGIEPTYLPALIDTAIAHLYDGNHNAVEKALLKVDRASPGHSAAKKIREMMGRGSTVKGNAARRSMMGQPLKAGPGAAKDTAEAQQKMAAMKSAAAQAQRGSAKGAGMGMGKGGGGKGKGGGMGKGKSGDGKHKAPDTASNAQAMMEQMRTQLESEVQRRKKLGLM